MHLVCYWYWCWYWYTLVCIGIGIVIGIETHAVVLRPSGDIRRKFSPSRSDYKALENMTLTLPSPHHYAHSANINKAHPSLLLNNKLTVTEVRFVKTRKEGQY